MARAMPERDKNGPEQAPGPEDTLAVQAEAAVVPKEKGYSVTLNIWMVITPSPLLMASMRMGKV